MTAECPAFEYEIKELTPAFHCPRLWEMIYAFAPSLMEASRTVAEVTEILLGADLGDGSV